MQMTFKGARIPVLVLFTGLTWLGLAWGGEPAAPAKSWATGNSYEKLIRNQPGIVRYYTFESVTSDNSLTESIAGQSEPIAYAGPDKLTIVAGRTPDRKAVRLDHGCFEGRPIDVADALTVSMWFRKHGQGGQLGNGSTNGMLLAQGDGYWTGWRIYTNYPQQDLLFQIGRPKPSSAISLRVDEPVPDGVWHHVATSWDGTQMRLYLNGLLLGAVPYDGPYSATTGKLRVGYANAGVGSIKMDVDEVAIFRRALSAEEILRQACPAASLSASARTLLSEAVADVAQPDWNSAEAGFSRLACADNLPGQLRAIFRWGWARAILKQGRFRRAVQQYTRVFQSDDATPALRAIAVRRCVHVPRGVFDVTASKEVYERLMETPGLSAAERMGVRLSLAECLMREGDGTGAREQYEAVLESRELDAGDAWNIRLQLGHSHLCAGDDPGARAAYQRLAGMPGCPAAIRGIALLGVGHAWFLQRDYPAAAEAFAKAAETNGLVEHHRWEARERAGEMLRLAKGLPARDPTATRIRVPQPPEPGIVLHVAPNGDDTNPGTSELPLATFVGARDAIRSIKSKQGLPPGGIRVLVADGTYPARQTFELTEADSGTAEAPIVYQGRPGEYPGMSGGVVLRGICPVTDPQILRRLPEAARGHVQQIDLKAQGITDYGSIGQRGYGRAGFPTHPWVDVYVDGKPMQLARWPNEDFLKTGKIHQDPSTSGASDQSAVIEYEGDRPRRWAEASDAWMFGYWRRLWAARSIKVAAIDLQRRRITTDQSASYGFYEGQPYYFFNLLEELDTPGEWYLDRQSGVLYLWLPYDVDGQVVDLPLLSEPFVRMENVSYVTLRGLAFDLGRAEGCVIRGGARNLVAGCVFHRLGTNGLIVQGGSGHGVLGCDINTLGAGGVRMSGGDRKTLTPGGHFVSNCHIHDFSRVDRVYAPAVHLDGVGNRISHNLFHNSPHHAMRVEGYEHVVEWNEIHSVVYEADDQAGIDIYGNPAYRGLILRYNYWHHIGSGHNVAGQSGIRLDDFISRVLMYSNVFYRASGGRFGGIQIHGGKDNIADNNLLIRCKYGFSFSPWGTARWRERLASERTQAVVRQGGVDIHNPPHSTRYPDLAEMQENADRNFVWRNVSVDCGQFSARERGVNEMIDNVAFGDDPGFADTGDYSLLPDSPLLRRLGFRPIPVHEIGLYQDEYRATWPPRHNITPHYVQEF